MNHSYTGKQFGVTSLSKKKVGLMGKVCHVMGTGLALWLMIAQVRAQDFAYTTNNEAVTVWMYSGPGGNVTIPAAIGGLPVTAIGSQCFLDNKNLMSVVIPSSVTNIGDLAFSECEGLSEVSIPDGVLSLGARAFEGCYGLTNVTIGRGVTSIPFGAFSDCNLSAVSIPDSVLEIGEYAFNYCIGLTNVSMGRNVTTIGSHAFVHCSSLANVNLPNSVTSIGDWAFNFCYSLTNITISESATNIGIGAFYDCPGLKTVELPGSVLQIGDFAFWGCSSLANVAIPGSVTNIGNRVFELCANITGITVSPDNSTYSSLDGVLFNKNYTTLIEYPSGKSGSYTIPNTVTNIGDQAFSECSTLANVTFGSGVVSIGVGAFGDCIALTRATIPGSVTSIGDVAFASCSGLTNIYFQGNPPVLGWDVFADYIGQFSVQYINAIVYFLPGTTGWGATFGGLTTVLWNPQVLTKDGNFGVRENRFGFNTIGTPEIPLVVEASTNAAAGPWVSLQTCTLTNGLIHFSDAQWTNYPGRFYRIRSP